MAKKLIKEVVLKKLKRRKLTLISEYVNYRTNAKFKCDICNNIWETKAGVVLRGFGCPECGKTKAKNTKKWNLGNSHMLKKIDKKFLKKIEILSDYKGQLDNISVKCKICEYKWSTKPYYLYRKQGCHKCGHKSKGLKHRTGHNEFCDHIDKYHNGTIKILSNYVGGRKPIKFRCLICNNDQEKSQAFRLRSRGCIYCIFSKGEKKIEKILKENNILFKPQFVFDDCINEKTGHKLRFDFAVFKKGKFSHLIEYDGLQHFKSYDIFGGNKRFKNQKVLDKIKDEYCKNKKIRLIRINYKNYSNFTLNNLL